MKESIDSILSQTLKDFEFIIIDDGSTDRTEVILKKYYSQDHRIKIIKNETQLGIVKSLNKGIESASGKYVARMDDDDISLPTRFARQVAYLDHNPKTVMVSCGYKRINKKGEFLNYSRHYCSPYLAHWYLLYHNFVGGHSQVMFRRNVALKVGGYQENNLYVEDYGLWSRFMNVGEIAVLPEILHAYRYHEESVSRKNHLIQENNALAISGDNISYLLGRKLDRAEIVALKSIWAAKGVMDYPLPSLAGVLSSRFREIYKAFIRKNKKDIFSSVKQRWNLQVEIGSRFYKWVDCLDNQYTLFNKMRIITYGIIWHPFGILRFILGKLKRKIYPLA